MLMADDHGAAPMSTRLRTWAGTLPWFAAEVVSHSDTARPHVHVELAATPDQLKAARSAITGWARRIGLGDTQQQDIVLATEEAISNAIEHAYPGTRGTVTLFAACTDKADTVRVIVSDRGLWRPPPVDRGFRGRGLAMMERLAEVFRLAHTPSGTTVMMGWSPRG